MSEAADAKRLTLLALNALHSPGCGGENCDPPMNPCLPCQESASDEFLTELAAAAERNGGSDIAARLRVEMAKGKTAEK